MPLRITISCCNNLFGEGIKRLIEEDRLEIDCITHISTPEKVIDTKPDILITDFHTLSLMSINTLFKHKVGILLLWTGCLPKIEDERLLGFISRGLIGILLPEETTFLQLKRAIKSVTSGELWFTRKKLKDIISCMREVKEEVRQLTKREIEIIKMICKGYRNKQITKSLGITDQSVKKHLNHIYKKAGVTDRLQLALYAIKHWSFCINTNLNQAATNKKGKSTNQSNNGSISTVLRSST